MTYYDHNAIRKAYPDTIGLISDEEGVFDRNGKDITSTIDQSLVDAARVELNKENYKHERYHAYPTWESQLDYIYHNGLDKWKTDIVDPVKAKYPKPS